jgi:hypothetical protein
MFKVFLCNISLKCVVQTCGTRNPYSLLQSHNGEEWQGNGLTTITMLFTMRLLSRKCLRSQKKMVVSKVWHNLKQTNKTNISTTFFDDLRNKWLLYCHWHDLWFCFIFKLSNFGCILQIYITRSIGNLKTNVSFKTVTPNFSQRQTSTFSHIELHTPYSLEYFHYA